MTKGQFQPGTHWRAPQPHWQREWLEREYLYLQRSTGEIAAAIGCTDSAILHWLKKHGIPRRTISGARSIKRWGVQGALNPMFGKIGILNPRYVDGSSPERQRLYVRCAGRAFLRRILQRDNYRCVRCGAPNTGRKTLHVHHLASWAGNPELRFADANVVTLCRCCHRFVHSRRNARREYLA